MAYTVAATIKDKQAKGGKMEVSGYLTLTGNYATATGIAVTAKMFGLHVLDNLNLEEQVGINFNYVPTNDASGKVMAYWSGSAAVAGSLGGSTAATSHTHTLTLAASAAGSSHNHAFAFGGTIDNENAHTHAVALDGGATGAGDAHTHAWTPGGATDAGAAHTHAFTGTAITAVNFDVDDNDAAAADGVAVYVHTHDGTIGHFEFVSPTNASGVSRLNASGPYVKVLDSDNAATDGLVLYCDEDAADGSRLQVINPLGTDIYVPASNGQYIKLTHNANAAADGVAVYFDEDVANVHDRMMFVSPTDTDATNATSAVYHALAPVPSGTNANESTHTHGVTAVTGTNANESTHTHGPGTLSDAASGVGSAHSHGYTGLTGTNTAEATHTHALTGTTVDAETAHVHGATGLTFTGTATTAAAQAEVTNGTSMTTWTRVEFFAVGH